MFFDIFEFLCSIANGEKISFASVLDNAPKQVNDLLPKFR